MKVIVAGSRGFYDYDFLLTKLNKLFTTSFFNKEITEVVSGTARGADQLGEAFANRFGIEVKRFPADWNKHGKAAGMIRNKEMAKYANVLVAFWDGESKGTKGMINEALKQKLEIHVFTYES